MHSQLRRLIFFVSLFLLTTISHAQHAFVATDFAACGVGLRDSSGVWIVPPIYQEINYSWGGYYQVLLGSKEGMIDRAGKIIIPVIYDDAYASSVQKDSTHTIIVFHVRNGEEYGLLNAYNEVIVPVVCRSVTVDRRGLIIAEKSKKRYSIYSTDGRETIIPGKQPEAPYALSDHLIRVARNVWPLRYKYADSDLSEWGITGRKKLLFKKKYGVINDSFRLIVPKEFSSVTYYPGKYQLITVEDEKKTGYYSITGKQVWAPVYKLSFASTRNIYIDSHSESFINAYGYAVVKSGEKFGIIGANGDTVLPFQYDNIRSNAATDAYGANTLIVTQGNFSGLYFPPTREWLLQPEYESLFFYASYNTYSDSLDNFKTKKSGAPVVREGPPNLRVIIAKKNNKYGMITSGGQVLLPFVYDNYYKGDHSSCYFFKDTSCVWVSIPEYRNVINRYTVSRAVETAPVNLLFTEIKDASGATLFINPDVLNDSAQLSLYKVQPEDQINNPQTYNHHLHAAAFVITPLYSTSTIPGICKVYTLQNTDLNYFVSAQSKEIAMGNKEGNGSRIVLINTVGQDKYHTYYKFSNKPGIFREDGFYVLPPESYITCERRSDVEGIATFYVNNGKNKKGIIDGNGKLLLDTVWGKIGRSGGNYVWVVKKEYKHFKKRNQYNWNILDTTTNELILAEEKRVSQVTGFGTKAVIVNTREGKELFNLSSRKFVLDSVRNLVAIDLAGNYFAFKTCTGHIGITDGEGKWLTDTSWTAMINASNAKKNGYAIDKNYTYCVLSSETSWLIFDTQKGVVLNDTASERLLLHLAATGYVTDSAGKLTKICPDCPSYGYRKNAIANAQLPQWQSELLFDSLFMGEHFIADTSYFWFDPSCISCRERSGYMPYTWSKNYDRQTLHHTISFQTDSCISVARQNLSFSSLPAKCPVNLFFTAMLFPDGMHTMLLDSLFTGTEWKTVIADEASAYFLSHPGITGNCHNPYMLPAMMKDRFLLTPNGIELFPPNYKEYNKQLSIPVSWEKLKPYLRPDVAKKLNIK